jgi:hypothetical protein
MSCDMPLGGHTTLTIVMDTCDRKGKDKWSQLEEQRRLEEKAYQARLACDCWRNKVLSGALFPADWTQATTLLQRLVQHIPRFILPKQMVVGDWQVAQKEDHPGERSVCLTEQHDFHRIAFSIDHRIITYNSLPCSLYGSMLEALVHVAYLCKHNRLPEPMLLGVKRSYCPVCTFPPMTVTILYCSHGRHCKYHCTWVKFISETGAVPP